MNLNKVELIGNLIRDPKSRKLPSGQSVTSFSMATYHRWKDSKTKKKKESVEFHNVLAWGRVGEIVVSYLRKGDKAYIEGRLQTRQWQDKQGNRRSKTEIVVSNLIMLGKASAVKTKVAKDSESGSASEEVNVEEVPIIEVE